jgi:hypothetical protein
MGTCCYSCEALQVHGMLRGPEADSTYVAFSTNGTLYPSLAASLVPISYIGNKKTGGRLMLSVSFPRPW